MAAADLCRCLITATSFLVEESLTQHIAGLLLLMTGNSKAPF